MKENALRKVLRQQVNEILRFLSNLAAAYAGASLGSGGITINPHSTSDSEGRMYKKSNDSTPSNKKYKGKRYEAVKENALDKLFTKKEIGLLSVAALGVLGVLVSLLKSNSNSKAVSKNIQDLENSLQSANHQQNENLTEFKNKLAQTMNTYNDIMQHLTSNSKLLTEFQNKVDQILNTYNDMMQSLTATNEATQNNEVGLKLSTENLARLQQTFQPTTSVNPNFVMQPTRSRSSAESSLRAQMESLNAQLCSFKSAMGETQRSLRMLFPSDPELRSTLDHRNVTHAREFGGGHYLPSIPLGETTLQGLTKSSDQGNRFLDVRPKRTNSEFSVSSSVLGGKFSFDMVFEDLNEETVKSLSLLTKLEENQRKALVWMLNDWLELFKAAISNGRVTDKVKATKHIKYTNTLMGTLIQDELPTIFSELPDNDTEEAKAARKLSRKHREEAMRFLKNDEEDDEEYCYVKQKKKGNDSKNPPKPQDEDPSHDGGGSALAYFTVSPFFTLSEILNNNSIMDALPSLKGTLITLEPKPIEIININKRLLKTISQKIVNNPNSNMESLSVESKPFHLPSKSTNFQGASCNQSLESKPELIKPALDFKNDILNSGLNYHYLENEWDFIDSVTRFDPINSNKTLKDSILTTLTLQKEYKMEVCKIPRSSENIDYLTVNNVTTGCTFVTLESTLDLLDTIIWMQASPITSAVCLPITFALYCYEYFIHLLLLGLITYFILQTVIKIINYASVYIFNYDLTTHIYAVYYYLNFLVCLALPLYLIYCNSYWQLLKFASLYFGHRCFHRQVYILETIYTNNLSICLHPNYYYDI